MAMSRKHFQAIATVMATVNQSHHDSATVRAIANKLADYFATERPYFNRGIFLDACGMYDADKNDHGRIVR